jgi:exopolysaccharide production protein ExoQ
MPIVVTKLFIEKGGLGEVLSMTGRIPFWYAMLSEGLPKQPWLGFGFMRIANEGLFSSVHTYSADNPHNAFIAVLMNLGFVGLFIALFQLVFFIRGWMNCHDARKKLMIAGLFIPIIINSFTEFGIFGLTNYGILFYQIAFFYVAIQFNPVFSKREKLFLHQIRPGWQSEESSGPAAYIESKAKARTSKSLGHHSRDKQYDLQI